MKWITAFLIIAASLSGCTGSSAGPGEGTDSTIDDRKVEPVVAAELLSFAEEAVQEYIPNNATFAMAMTFEAVNASADAFEEFGWEPNRTFVDSEVADGKSMFWLYGFAGEDRIVIIAVYADGQSELVLLLPERDALPEDFVVPSDWKISSADAAAIVAEEEGWLPLANDTTVTWQMDGFVGDGNLTWDMWRMDTEDGVALIARVNAMTGDVEAFSSYEFQTFPESYQCSGLYDDDFEFLGPGGSAQIEVEIEEFGEIYFQYSHDGVGSYELSFEHDGAPIEPDEHSLSSSSSSGTYSSSDGEGTLLNLGPGTYTMTISVDSASNVSLAFFGQSCVTTTDSEESSTEAEPDDGR